VTPRARPTNRGTRCRKPCSTFRCRGIERSTATNSASFSPRTLGWLFDGFETYALFLTVGFALHQLLEASQYAETPRYAGYILATTVFGWATGGVIGGIIADYIGRKRTMMLAVLAYTLTTGLSAIAWNWESFAILRFLVGIGIGSEWVTGASLVSELWPDHARAKGGGLLQSGAGIGSFLASGVWLLIGGLAPNSWRLMYLIGVLPALLVLWLRRNMPESPRWEASRQRRRTAHAQRLSGAALDGEAAALTRFTVTDMFLDPGTSRNTASPPACGRSRRQETRE
jgi:MFS family permease